MLQLALILLAAEPQCERWADAGECEANAAWMRPHCAAACCSRRVRLGACDGADGANAAHHHRPHANVSWADLKDALGGKKFARFADVAAKFGYDAGRDCAAVAPARGRRRR